MALLPFIQQQHFILACKMTSNKSMGDKGLFDWDVVKVTGVSLASISTALTEIDLVVKILCGLVALAYGVLKLHLLWKNRNKPPEK